VTALNEMSHQSLTALLTQGADAVAPEAAVSGLSAEQAHARLEGWPHSIAEILVHVVYWQERILNAVVTGRHPGEAHSPQAWPATTPEEWPALVARFLRARESAREVAESADLGWVTAGDQTIGLLLASGAQHTAHHVGQIVLMRHLLGLPAADP
jgi:uncharacterized damage-inducible protein DinB